MFVMIVNLQEEMKTVEKGEIKGKKSVKVLFWGITVV